MRPTRWIIHIDGEIYGRTARLTLKEAQRLVGVLLPELEDEAEFLAWDHASVKQRQKSIDTQVFLDPRSKIYRTLVTSEELGPNQTLQSSAAEMAGELRAALGCK